MEPKLLLIRLITLLYKESLIKDHASRSLALAKQVIESIKLPETGSEFNEVRDCMQGLQKAALALIENTQDTPFDRESLLQRIRIAAGTDESVYEAFSIGIGAEDGEKADIRKQCQTLTNEIRDQLDMKRFADIAKTMYQKAYFGQASMVGSLEFIQEMRDALGDLGRSTTHSIKGMVDQVYFENEETAIGVMERARESLSSEGALVFGQQAINEACFDNPGALRGEYWNVSALSHNYKTGLGLNVFVDLPLLNKPWMIDPNKKPLIVHLSTEDSVEKNVMTVYQLLMERETNEPCSVEGVDPVVAAHYVKKRLNVNGYHTYMCRVDPSDTSIADVKELIEQLEGDGYEIHAVIFDYPPMLDQTGLTKGATGNELRDIHRRLRNLFSKKRIFCLSFHQLGPGAQAYKRAGVEDFVKVVAGKGLYDGSSKVFQEFDVDITIDIERIGDDAYLAMQWAKHRKLKRTPRNLWYAAMRLSDVGGLRPDVVLDEEGHLKKLAPNFVRDLKPLRQNQGGGDWYKDAVKENELF